ncbi:MAG: Minf_1886 family protein [Candidatus Krumholzibacteriia bacterium]
MNREPGFWEAIERIRAADDRLKPAAYPFMMETLDFTMRTLGERRHVTARELLDGLCGYARHRFGLLAGTVLENWGISSGRDVGRAVFQLVNAQILSRRESDRLEDFDIDYDLTTRLEDKYLE